MHQHKCINALLTDRYTNADAHAAWCRVCRVCSDFLRGWCGGLWLWSNWHIEMLTMWMPIAKMLFFFCWFLRHVLHCSMEDSWERVLCVEQNGMLVDPWSGVCDCETHQRLSHPSRLQTDACYPTFLAEQQAADTAVPNRFVSTSMFVILSGASDCRYTRGDLWYFGNVFWSEDTKNVQLVVNNNNIYRVLAC